MSKPTGITDQQFEKEVIQSEVPVVIDFWAPWCAPCRMVGPVVESLSEQMNGSVKFVKINVDENTEHAAKYGIQGIPTLLLFKGGDLVDTVVGAYPEQALRERITQAFGVESGDQ